MSSLEDVHIFKKIKVLCNEQNSNAIIDLLKKYIEGYAANSKEVVS